MGYAASFLELKGLLIEVIHNQARIVRKVENAMSKISDVGAAMNAYFDRQAVAIDGVKGDVDWLVAKIAELQASSGAVSAEDQAILDALQARAGVMADKVEALDAMTPPPAA